MKKGQSATEYLIIWGVVIIIALIVVGVMGGLPNPFAEINETEPREGDVGIWFCSKKGMNLSYQEFLSVFVKEKLRVYCRKIESHAEVIEDSFIIEFPLAKQIMINEGWKRNETENISEIE